MASFRRMIRFQSVEDTSICYAELDSSPNPPEPGTSLEAYNSYGDLAVGRNGKTVTFGSLLAPIVDPEIPVYCVGLNYRSHAAEAKLNIPQYPPLWTKPKASLADPDVDIPINKFCAGNMLDYEGELVFITSKECRNISPEEAPSYILGYTVGNDLSCRAFQLPSACGDQFFFAKAFDKFAPIGPILVSAEGFEKLATEGDVTLTTKVNGEVRQSVDCLKDLIFKPAQILSHMSQGTTIPAFTPVMTGTPAGVGLFMDEKGTFLQNGDVIEVEIGGIGVLRNKVVFE